MNSVLRDKLGDTVRENELLSRHANFRIGGPAKYFFESKMSEEIIRAVKVAGELNIPFFVLGGGSNVLISDNGFDGLVIKMANRNFSIEGTTVRAEAGVLSAMLARKTAEAGLTGFEWAISLPGTIGGGVRGNAGCFGGEMRDHLMTAHVLMPDGGLKDFSNEDCKFAYRDSIFKHLERPSIILSATFEFSKDESEKCLARMNEKLQLRREKQPLDSSSAGCMFKNFEFHDRSEIAKLERAISVPQTFIDAKRIPAGWIVEHLEFMGTQVGDIRVSDKHANFLQNLGKGTADQVLQLVSIIKTKARDKWGIQLHEEVQLVGF